MKSDQSLQSTSNKADFEQIVDLAFEYYETAPEFFGKVNEKKVVYKLATAMTKHPAFTYKVDGEIVG